MTDRSPLSMLILGDICPTEDTRALFDSGAPEAVFGTLAPLVREADIAIANLECVLTSSAQPADKIGPILQGRPQDAILLAEAGFDVLGIANNHIKDCGAAGVIDTLEACARAGLRTTGAAAHAKAAAAPTVIACNGWKIGVMALAEHEFNAAEQDEAGAHIFDPLTDLERLSALRAECDYVIVLYHGGIEYHPYPSPLLQRTCRALVRNGAHLVLCQHSHVIGTFESYADGHVLYGQGNTVFGFRPGKPTWNEGLAVCVTLTGADAPKVEINLLPIGCDASGRVDMLSESAAEACLSLLAARGREAADAVMLQQKWDEFCARLAFNQLPQALGLGLWVTRANRLLRGALVRLIYRRRQRMVAMNMTRCDAHREVTLTAFRQILDPVARN